MMDQVENVLKEGREIFPGEEDTFQTLSQQGLCSKQTIKFVYCANPEDPDYEYIDNRDCEGEIYLESSPYICPSCDRIISEINSKKVHEKEVVELDRSAIRDYVRIELKDCLDCKAVSVNRTYFGHKFEFILDIDRPDVNIFLMFSNPGLESLNAIKIYNENPVLILISETKPQKRMAVERNIPYLKFSEMFLEGIENHKGQIAEGEKDELADREMRAELSLNACTDEKTLIEMGYSGFERCVQNLLVGSIMNSQMFGSSEIGRGVPDGQFCLQNNGDPQLFMWDAKFVDYDPDGENETDLKGEYDRIFRHLSTIESIPAVQNKFDSVSGIVLISPGINESNVRRLSEFVKENSFIQNTDWNGTVCYFELQALINLYKSYRNNRSNVKKKEKIFRAVLYKYLTSPAKHVDDPEIIRETAGDCLKMSSEDINEVFSNLQKFEEEIESFDKQQYMAFLDLVSERVSE